MYTSAWAVAGGGSCRPGGIGFVLAGNTVWIVVIRAKR